MKAGRHIHDEHGWMLIMYGKTGFRKNDKMKKIIRSYKVKKDMEDHDFLCPEGSPHIKEKVYARSAHSFRWAVTRTLYSPVMFE